MADVQLYPQAGNYNAESEEARSSSQPNRYTGIRSLRGRLLIFFLLIALLTGVPLIIGRSWPVQDLLLLVVVEFVVITILSVFLAGFITQPIVRITKASERITTGDLYVQVPESADELGLLARALNGMTAQLRKMLVGMEQTVAQRTSELARVSEQMRKRAIQLQSVAEVAHAITSVQDPDILLKQVTDLISKNFGFYHVGIFLMDKSGEYVILQAANSEGGQRMLARGHRLRVGEEGIVGYASEQGLPRVAEDVGDDSVYFNNPDLPYTQSEAAIPLRVGNLVIGALDVQSMEKAAFKDEDIALLTTLADQVAIAIENARLFRETRNALAELETLHRQYLRKAWADMVAEKRSGGYAYSDGHLSPLPESKQDDVWNALQDGKVIHAGPTNGKASPEITQNSAALIVPITVRGQVIGIFDLGEPEEPYQWNEDEINLVKTVIDQVGLAIENARLIEETQRRAEREHLVADITTKLRASNDPQTILQTAAQELRQALRAKRTQVIIQPPEGFTTVLTDDPSTISLQ